MEEYVDDDGLLDEDLLAEPLRTFYRELRKEEKMVRQWTDELKDALGRGLEPCNAIIEFFVYIQKDETLECTRYLEVPICGSISSDIELPSKLEISVV